MKSFSLSSITKSLKKQIKFPIDDKNKTPTKLKSEELNFKIQNPNIPYKEYKGNYKKLLEYVVFYGELQNDGSYALEYEKNGRVVSINAKYEKPIMIHSISKDSFYNDPLYDDDYTGLQIFDNNLAILNKGIVDHNNGKIHIKEKLNINEQEEVEDWIKIYIKSHILCDKTTIGKNSHSDIL